MPPKDAYIKDIHSLSVAPACPSYIKDIPGRIVVSYQETLKMLKTNTSWTTSTGSSALVSPGSCPLSTPITHTNKTTENNNDNNTIHATALHPHLVILCFCHFVIL